MRCAQFLSTLSLRRATNNPANQTNLPGYFYPRSPCGERPTYRILRAKLSPISIHALLAESDLLRLLLLLISSLFLSTLSLRRATAPEGADIEHKMNFYPRSPCGERPDSLTDDVSTGGFLSTLSLRRATYDTSSLMQCQAKFLSTLSLRRATREPTAFRTPHHKFLSTLSLRRATPGKIRILNDILYFYPRSPCGERPLKGFAMRWNTCISIHALLAESDIVYALKLANAMLFLSTLSLRRATANYFARYPQCQHFYPRSPCGERLPAGCALML